MIEFVYVFALAVVIWTVTGWFCEFVAWRRRRTWWLHRPVAWRWGSDGRDKLYGLRHWGFWFTGPRLR